MHGCMVASANAELVALRVVHDDVMDRVVKVVLFAGSALNSGTKADLRASTLDRAV